MIECSSIVILGGFFIRLIRKMHIPLRVPYIYIYNNFKITKPCKIVEYK